MVSSLAPPMMLLIVVAAAAAVVVVEAVVPVARSASHDSSQLNQTRVASAVSVPAQRVSCLKFTS